ncbi:MAG: hypothetical protein VKK04_06750, partial [Synechococcales bacterium]|nr:hypothetical protein [Synechococcales bacterium]
MAESVAIAIDRTSIPRHNGTGSRCGVSNAALRHPNATSIHSPPTPPLPPPPRQTPALALATHNTRRG